MANLKSSIKDVRRTTRRTGRNQARNTRLSTAIHAVQSAASRDAALAALKTANGLLDRAAHKDLVHWRTAARHKSRLAEFVNRKFPAAKK
jgi:small subunit ribosomal protein S20